MRIKAAIFITSFAFFVQPVFAQDATINTRIATREANFQQRIDREIQMLGQRKIQEASRQAQYMKKMETRDINIASAEAKLKLRLKQFKDQRRAEIVSRTNINLNKINKNLTSQMLENLNKMSAILDKIAVNPNASSQTIADAREAISIATQTVQAQAQKDYTIQVTSETQIRLDVQTKRNQLYKDIIATREQVLTARQKTLAAVKVVYSGSTQMKEGTISGQQ